jgi:hypothetical protein
VNRRLGAALANHIGRLPGAARFVLVEGVSVALAEGMAAAWNDNLPPLRVASAEPRRFGARALIGTSGTAMRNQRVGGEACGVVLVLCEGQQVADRQSLNMFESVSPSQLLDSPDGVALLAAQEPAVQLDGPAHAVKAAITQAGAASRPSAAAVADYLDRLADGQNALGALPVLGAFADSSGGVRVEAARIGDNLKLAARRTSEDLLRPRDYADLRRRAETVLRRRPGMRDDPVAAAAAADEVMTLLQSGNDALLERLQYDEAKEIFEQKSQDLVGLVVAALSDYRRGLDPQGQAAALPWEGYERRAHALRPHDEQRQAAQDLLDLDDAQQRHIFARPLRNKLERLLRDKAVNGSSPSCPEAAMVKAAQQLGGLIQRVQVLPPFPQPGQAKNGSSLFRVGGLVDLLPFCD